MKTYSGELKEGERYCTEDGSSYKWTYGSSYKDMSVIKLVYHDNEWQLYKPSQPKKVWGIPEVGQTYYILQQYFEGDFYIKTYPNQGSSSVKHTYLDKHTAEQRAKAERYINQFRALSDVPVDGVEQWFIDKSGDKDCFYMLEDKLAHAICGYVANSYEKAERDLAAYPKIALAHKIVTWGFHGGVVEEVL
jgi:hypothetical protein